MSKFQIFVKRLWVYGEEPIWSFIVNLVFWVCHLNKINWTRKEMDGLKYLSIETLMERFLWKKDSFEDWTPWIATIVYKSLTDDCDGAAALAKWHFKNKGIEAEVFHLFSDKSGHSICVTKDRTRMVSNNSVVHLFPETWEADILRYFNNKYEVIL